MNANDKNVITSALRDNSVSSKNDIKLMTSSDFKGEP